MKKRPIDKIREAEALLTGADTQIQIRVSEDRKKLYVEAARVRGISLSRWVILALDAALCALMVLFGSTAIADRRIITVCWGPMSNRTCVSGPYHKPSVEKAVRDCIRLAKRDGDDPSTCKEEVEEAAKVLADEESETRHVRACFRACRKAGFSVQECSPETTDSACSTDPRFYKEHVTRYTD